MRQVGKKICNPYQRKELVSIKCEKVFEISNKEINNPIVKQANNIT